MGKAGDFRIGRQDLYGFIELNRQELYLALLLLHSVSECLESTKLKLLDSLRPVSCAISRMPFWYRNRHKMTNR
jgi:hypothetical protein